MIEAGIGKVRPAKSGKSFGKIRHGRTIHRQVADRMVVLSKVTKPATSPVALPLTRLRLANLSSRAMVLDPFAGIGATVMASRLIGLDAVGLEIDPGYCRAAQRCRDEL
jgi:tRNA G10  N-methylase Trm11